MIVVTAPTSNIGRQVVERLLALDAPVRVIARDPARLSRWQDRIEVVQGSHSDADVIGRALEGAEALFWLVPPQPTATSLEQAYVDFTKPACAALRTAGVGRVVSISALGRGVVEKAGTVSAALRMDDLIAATGVAFRALTMPSFMDNVARQVAPIRDQGVFFGTLDPTLKCPTCATRDIAAVAARLLLDKDWSGQAEVPVLGPEDLSFDDMAGILSEILGKPVRYQRISLGDYRAGLIGMGMSDAVADGLVEMMEAKDKGLDNAAPRTAETTTPTHFRQWCEEVLRPAVAPELV